MGSGGVRKYQPPGRNYRCVLPGALPAPLPLTEFRFCIRAEVAPKVGPEVPGMSGSTGLWAGISAFKIPGELPAALSLMKIRYWFLPEPGPELGPELPLVQVLPGLRAEVPPWQD